jgi:teichuronic acid biosynthesis glycosyltransferase TuaC
MKVLVVSNMYPTAADKIRGLFIHQQVRELMRQGCDVKVVSPVPETPLLVKYISRKWKRYSDIPERERPDEVEVFHPRYLELPRTWGIASSGKRMYRGAHGVFKDLVNEFRFDIIHAHVILPDGYTAMLLSQELEKPFVVTVHGQDFQQTMHKNDRCKRIIERVISLSSKTVTVSDKLKKIAESELDIDPGRIMVIPNGIDRKDVVREKEGANHPYKEKVVLVSVSNLVETKGIDLNIRAIGNLKKKYKDILYIVIGEGEERKKLERLVEELRVEDTVLFMGQLPHRKVLKYMERCDIFSLPSWNEGFGVVYLEAMASGKPVIGCRGEGIDGIIRHGETGMLVEPKDVASLTDTLDFLISNREESKRFGTRARKLVLDNYTWENSASALICLYRQVLGDSC